MNINPAEALRGIAAYGGQSAQAKKAAPATANSRLKPDEAIISSKGVELGNIVRQIRESGDVRPELVAELKGKIASGAYYVSSYDLAGKIMEASKGLV
jgi:flagellar biosynthesis anti-sigma factor FlgM